MRVISLLIFIGSVAEWSGAQFLNNRPFPTYSLESMPDTDFTCRDKVLGGYYADPETECQMFHVCVKVAGVGVQDFRFLCPNGTAFDQDHQICAEWGDVDCDATTLYYSSDNFDLYRIGSGFESKAVKYGEEEETFALQRAETGDARINHEHQVQRVNQQKQLEAANFARKKPTYTQYNNADNSERDIFKGSSSSNFYNNRNGGKDLDDEEDDRNVNVNQDRDQEQRRKVNRPQNRRPQNQNGQSRRPAGFLNNFAGSSYATSPKPVSTTAAPVSEQQPVTRGRNGRPRQNNGQYNGDNFRQDNARNYDNNNQYNDRQNNYNQGSYTISTPAPFRQTQQFNNNNNNNNNQYASTTSAPKVTNENYPSAFPQQKQTFQTTKQTENYPSTYNQPRSSFPTTTTVQQKSTFTQKETENYPSSFPKKQASSYPTTPLATYEATKVKQTQNYQSSNTQKQPTTPAKPTDNYPTTFSPSKQTAFQNYPSTFSPRTNSAFTQLSQQTTQQQSQQFTHNSQSTQQNRQQFSQNTQQQYNSQSTQFNSFQATTSKPSPFTQYTPTVPKVSSTTPVIRSNRFDETQYDDGSYHQKYDSYDNKDSNEEFLKTAHSTNIAASRNELAKAAKTTLLTSTTAKPLYDSPRPFSVSTTNTPKATEAPKAIAKVENPSTTNTQSVPAKKDKNVSYDYAYYDSNPQHDHEYEIDTDFKKSVANKQ